MRTGAPSLRWAACFALALGFHGAGAAALLARWNDSADQVANAPLIMIDLAPEAVAPETTVNDRPPDQVARRAEEPEPEPEPIKPIEKVELPPPDVKPEVTLPPPPKLVEQPKEKKKLDKNKALASAPSVAPERADRAAAPLPGASSRDSNAVPNWKSQLVAQIERNKRFSGSDRGTVQVSFSVDRTGAVHNARVARSSGSSLLDSDALAWLQRSQPLPPPPPEMPGRQIGLSIPMRYNFR